MDDAGFIDLIAEEICDSEFGSMPGRWKRLLESAAADPETFSAHTLWRLRRTAERILNKIVGASNA